MEDEVITKSVLDFVAAYLNSSYVYGGVPNTSDP